MLNKISGVSVSEAWRLARLAELTGKIVIDAARLSGSVGNGWLRKFFAAGGGLEDGTNAHQKRTQIIFAPALPQ